MIRRMSVLELIEQVVEFTHDQGITTEMKKGVKQLVSPAMLYIKELTKRVDEHNNYAKMFQEATTDIAFIKGKMEGM